MSQIEVDKVIPQSGTALQVGDSGDTITIPAGATITNNGTANGFGSADTEKVKVSANDTTAGFLNGKLVAGTNISLTEGSDGGNETLTAALSGTIATAQIADDAVTLAKMAPGTDGNIISYDASGNPVAVATGSAGQVLTSAGAGAPPTFSTAASSDVVLLHTTAAMSGSTVAVDNVFSATYTSYRVVITNYYPASDTIPEFRFRNGGGGSNDSKYCYVHDRVEVHSGGVATATTASAWNNTLAAWSQSVDGGNGGYTQNAIIDIFNPILTIPTWWTTASNGWDPTQAWVVNMTGGGVYNNSSAIDGIQFSTSSGNISGGVLKIYGFK